MRAILLGCVSVCALALAPMVAAQNGGLAGQCFDQKGKPIGPVYQVSQPNHHWITWVQARGGACRPLYASEVSYFTAQKRGYDPAYTPPGAAAATSKTPDAAPKDAAPKEAAPKSAAPKEATPPGTAPSDSGPASPPPKVTTANAKAPVQRPATAAAPAPRAAQPPAAAPKVDVWKGDSARAARLLIAAYSASPRDRLVVIDTGRNIEREDGIWRVFQVRWADGVVVPVAVRVNLNGHMDFQRLTENYPTTSSLKIGR